MGKSNQFQISLYLLDPVDFSEINHLASFFYGNSHEIRLYCYSGTYYIHVNDIRLHCGYDFRVLLSSNDVLFPFITLRSMLLVSYLQYCFDNELL